MKEAGGAGLTTGDYDLLTVDVWDTLLRRRCHPDSVKLHVARYLALNLGPSLAATCRDPWVLLRLRQQAEKEVGDECRRSGLDDEYRHRDVYRRWLALAGLAPSGDAKDMERLMDALEAIEYGQERYVSYADPHVARTLAGINASSRLFLSDFYLPAPAIRDLLSHHGLEHLVSDGVVSCEIGLNKRSGRLYRHVQEKTGVVPQRHVHVGDNPHADVRAARDAGVAAVHFQPDDEHRLRRVREQGFHARQDMLRHAVEESLSLPLPAERRLDAPYLFGRRVALMLVGFVLWVMERAVADHVGKVHFFTREGEFFIEIYRRLAAADVLGFPAPPADLLKVSRLATFAGSLREFSADELMRLWNQYSVQSLQALFASLGIASDALAVKAGELGLAFGHPIQYPWQDERVLAFLGDPVVRGEVERQLAEKRGNLMAYLKTAGLSAGNKATGIVDIGWRGTIQDNLAYALPTVTWHGYYLGLNRFLNAQPENVRKSAFGPNTNQEPDRGRLLDFVAPIEMLCNSPNGSVTGYVPDGHHISVHRQVDRAENEIYESFTCHFQAGVLDAVAYWADFLRTHAYAADEIRPLAMSQWGEIVSNPPAFLAAAYFRLNHNEVFGVGGFRDKREMLSIGELWLAVVSRKHRARLRSFLAEMGWPPGLLACSDISPAFRWSLRLVLWGIEMRAQIRRFGRP